MHDLAVQAHRVRNEFSPLVTSNMINKRTHLEQIRNGTWYLK